MTRREMLGWPLLGLFGAAFAAKGWGAPRESPGSTVMEVRGKTVIDGDLIVTGEVIHRSHKAVREVPASIGVGGEPVVVFFPSETWELGGPTPKGELRLEA